jgi:sugar O-acyltransferase (sialic acid O-acetyltransferase NeuD family)
MKKPVVLFGNASIAREVCTYLTVDSSYEVVAFTVDAAYIDDDELMGRPVVPFEQVRDLYPPDRHAMFIAVGYVGLNRLRADRYQQAKEMGYELISHVSNTATTCSDLEVGDNCFVGPQSLLGPAVTLGNNVMIGPGCRLGHDVEVGDHAFVGLGVVVAGWVSIGDRCFIAPGATLRNHISIGEQSVIGVGAVVLESVEPREVWVGQSAERLPIQSGKLELV